MLIQQLTFQLTPQILVDYDFLKSRPGHLMKSVSSDEKLVLRIMICSVAVQSRNKMAEKVIDPHNHVISRK